ncbi:hypothetical protein NMY22_g17983 [Coprinellus aureogranulatus]|nr:hypothetical protein NMY22_g17983 [Coprinellus aureogranulatus]
MDMHTEEEEEEEEESTDPEYFTSRFRCTKCSVYDSVYAEDECFDFKGLCTHECTINGKKGNGKAKWRLENFGRDEKLMMRVFGEQAISVLKKLEKAVKEQFPRGALDKNMVDKYLGLSFDTWDKKREPHVWDTKVLCMSCEVPILMDGKSAIGHSHRHEDMQLSFVWSDTRTTHLSEEVQELLKVYRGEVPDGEEGTRRQPGGFPQIGRRTWLREQHPPDS